jgi:Zn finger protein HypA/HybF involved in hydrogenase expression
MLKKSNKKIKSGAIRAFVRERDNYTCQQCKKEWQEGERAFHVHHTDAEFENTVNHEYESENMDKLITLCPKCHMNQDSVIRSKKLSRGIEEDWDNIKVNNSHYLRKDYRLDKVNSKCKFCGSIYLKNFNHMNFCSEKCVMSFLKFYPELVNTLD